MTLHCCTRFLIWPAAWLSALLLTFATGNALAQDIMVIHVEGACATVSTTTITTTNAVLQAVNQWRLAQILVQAQPGSPGCPACTPPVPAVPATPAVLKYPTAGDFWRSIVRETIKPLLTEYHAAIIAKRGEIEARQAELKALEAAAWP